MPFPLIPAATLAVLGYIGYKLNEKDKPKAAPQLPAARSDDYIPTMDYPYESELPQPQADSGGSGGGSSGGGSSGGSGGGSYSPVEQAIASGNTSVTPTSPASPVVPVVSTSTGVVPAPAGSSASSGGGMKLEGKTSKYKTSEETSKGKAPPPATSSGGVVPTKMNQPGLVFRPETGSGSRQTTSTVQPKIETKTAFQTAETRLVMPNSRISPSTTSGGPIGGRSTSTIVQPSPASGTKGPSKGSGRFGWDPGRLAKMADAELGDDVSIFGRLIASDALWNVLNDAFIKACCWDDEDKTGKGTTVDGTLFDAFNTDLTAWKSFKAYAEVKSTAILSSESDLEAQLNAWDGKRQQWVKDFQTNTSIKLPEGIAMEQKPIPGAKSLSSLQMAGIGAGVAVGAIALIKITK
jgi:hypothetical protein